VARRHYHSNRRPVPLTRRPALADKLHYRQHPSLPAISSTPNNLLCYRNGQYISDDSNPAMYKLCIRNSAASKLWVQYSYRCPESTVFDPMRSQCMNEPTTTTTENTEIIIAASTHKETFAGDSDQVDKTTSPISLSTEEMSEFETTTVRIYDTTTFPEASSSSSSEEYVDMFLSHPHHFTQSAALKQSAHPLSWQPGRVVPATRPTTPTKKPFDLVSKPYHETIKWNSFRVTTELPGGARRPNHHQSSNRLTSNLRYARGNRTISEHRSILYFEDNG
jgi:hypothetical protein